ncbi:uncharacterized protein LOC122043847 [Zingiber officinale]|uniref:uncharacterized protein LOC122043847 n=1 Tax=Zingiber officinale TaxID=94328 RepID=UPI001C4CF9E1|nr:uncharacterized protein LOC122043847 [Zingiber officinale]
MRDPQPAKHKLLQCMMSRNATTGVGRKKKCRWEPLPFGTGLPLDTRYTAQRVALQEQLHKDVEDVGLQGTSHPTALTGPKDSHGPHTRSHRPVEIAHLPPELYRIETTTALDKGKQICEEDTCGTVQQPQPSAELMGTGAHHLDLHEGRVQSAAGNGVGRPSTAVRNRRWVDLFTKNRACSEDTALRKIEQCGGDTILTREDKEPLENTIGHCLIGRFLGRFPGWRGVQALRHRWNSPHKLLTHDNLWLVFKFNSKEQCDAILKGGPYIVHNSPLFLKAMPEAFTFKLETQTLMPLWMQIYGLPVDFWSTTGLSKIVSQVGTPLYTDLFTKTRRRVTFARALVEVDITKELPSTTTVVLPDGQREVLPLRFETVLKFCSHCRNLGHYRPCCPLAPSHGNQAECAGQASKRTILPRPESNLGMHTAGQQLAGSTSISEKSLSALATVQRESVSGPVQNVTAIQDSGILVPTQQCPQSVVSGQADILAISVSDPAPLISAPENAVLDSAPLISASDKVVPDSAPLISAVGNAISASASLISTSGNAGPGAGAYTAVQGITTPQGSSSGIVTIQGIVGSDISTGIQNIAGSSSGTLIELIPDSTILPTGTSSLRLTKAMHAADGGAAATANAAGHVSVLAEAVSTAEQPFPGPDSATLITNSGLTAPPCNSQAAAQGDLGDQAITDSIPAPHELHVHSVAGSELNAVVTENVMTVNQSQLGVSDGQHITAQSTIAISRTTQSLPAISKDPESVLNKGAVQISAQPGVMNFEPAQTDSTYSAAAHTDSAHSRSTEPSLTAPEQAAGNVNTVSDLSLQTTDSEMNSEPDLYCSSELEFDKITGNSDSATSSTEDSDSDAAGKYKVRRQDHLNSPVMPGAINEIAAKIK